jgi:hypothetical protein
MLILTIIPRKEKEKNNMNNNNNNNNNRTSKSIRVGQPITIMVRIVSVLCAFNSFSSASPIQTNHNEYQSPVDLKTCIFHFQFLRFLVLLLFLLFLLLLQFLLVANENRNIDCSIVVTCSCSFTLIFVSPCRRCRRRRLANILK